MNTDFLQINHTSLPEQLQNALNVGEVRNTYEFPQSQHLGESDEIYIHRLRSSAKQYQFVRVSYKGKDYFLAFHAPGPIITTVGTFMFIAGEVVGGEWGKHNFLFYPSLEQVKHQREILLRISSGCYSGMVLGDTTCDCQEEFLLSEKAIVANGSGIVVDIPGQDGRGWSEYKMAVQRLMHDLHLNTIDAAKRFYENTPLDRRSYTEFALLLKAFGFIDTQSFQVVNNNPFKTKALEAVGLQVTGTRTFPTENLSEEAKQNVAAKKAYWKHQGS